MAVVLAILPVLQFLRAKGVEDELARTSQALLTEMNARVVEHWMEERASEVVYLADQIAAETARSPGQFEQVAARLMSNHPEFLAFAAVNGEGQVLRARGTVREGTVLAPGSAEQASVAAAVDRTFVQLRLGPTPEHPDRLLLGRSIAPGDWVVLGVVKFDPRFPGGMPLRTVAGEPMQVTAQIPTGTEPFARIQPAGLAHPLVVSMQRAASGPTAGALAQRLGLGVGLALLAGVLVSVLLLTLRKEVLSAERALKSEAERASLQQRLAQADRLASVGLLATSVAHEVNNPLAFITGNVAFAQEELSRMVASEELPAGARSLLGEVQRAVGEALHGAQRVAIIVRDLKTFARGDAGGTFSVDLRQVLDSCARMADGLIRHRARLVKEYGQVPRVQGQESRLAQVFLNLLVNAAQAVPEGEPARHEIRIVTRLEALEVVVEVRDTGIGMSPAVLAQLFEPFFTTKPVGVGTGLGLSICRDLIQGVGGRIEVESQVGAGTTFRVRLPASTT